MSDAVLEQSVIKSLDSIDLVTMRRTRRFMDAYRYGLIGKVAAYAEKRHRGHRVLSQTILEEHELEGQLELV
ncbi:hypothetical protein FACS18942_08390 [Planctomycetales bacterium]|nr:hypothetical protein FACS18942_08390 [Planctomycetales bacterium]